MLENEIIERLIRVESLLEKQQSHPMPFAEAAEYMGLRPSTLYKLTSGAEVPHYKPHGKRIYFLKTDLDSWLLQHRVQTMKEIAAIVKVERRGADTVG
jgi:excisionase family DNA binding protein